MIRLIAPALLAAMPLAAHAQAAPPDRQLPGYSDDERGYTAGYSERSDAMRPGYSPPAPPGIDGGYRDDGGYGGYYDAPDDGYDQGYDDADAPPPVRPRSTRPAARSPYADRVARWRARADACEAGDMKACRGPE